MHRNVLVAHPWTPDGVAPAGAESAGDRIRESRRVKPAVLVVARQDRIHARIAVQTRGVGNEVGASRIPGRRIYHTATLQRSDSAELPIADQLIHDSTLVQEFLAFTKGKRVEDRGHETLRDVEVRRSFFTRGGAAGILGREGAAHRAANVA